MSKCVAEVVVLVQCMAVAVRVVAFVLRLVVACGRFRAIGMRMAAMRCSHRALGEGR